MYKSLDNNLILIGTDDSGSIDTALRYLDKIEEDNIKLNIVRFQ